MRWQGGRRSENVEDQRTFGGRGVVIGGGMGMLVILVVGLLLGVDPGQLFQLIGDPNVAQQGGPQEAPPEQEEQVDFVKVVLADTEDVWTELFRQMGRRYDPPKLRLFNGSVESACGLASAAVGPFYCPRDQRVYLDLGFFNELQQRFQAPGEFARAYVIAHEIGHHVQNLLGITDRLDQARGRVSQEEYNQLSVRLELQADFFAGVWAHHAQRARKILERGDLESAINAASAIGDDRLQRESRGYVTPDSFTHGTSAQRVRWFRKGFETGDVNAGDTFKAEHL